jgi:amidohydrolase
VFNAEYDALPNIGHACGHNLIASASLAGFLGVVAALKASGAPGRVRLLGTPAEEGGGGKLHLIDNGAYKDAAACLMTHPGPQYLLKDGVTGVAAVKMLANVKWRIVLTGRTAHAAMEPWNGANALDAVCLAYNAVSMLRQQIRPYQRIHGVFREAGDRPNIIPDRSVAEYYGMFLFVLVFDYACLIIPSSKRYPCVCRASVGAREEVFRGCSARDGLRGCL